jgi:hypothetical protein
LYFENTTTCTPEQKNFKLICKYKNLYFLLVLVKTNNVLFFVFEGFFDFIKIWGASYSARAILKFPIFLVLVFKIPQLFEDASRK